MTSAAPQSAAGMPWRKAAFAGLILAYFLYFNWDGLWAHFGADDMMNMAFYWRMKSVRLAMHLFMPWLGAYRPMAGVYYLSLLHTFGLNPAPFHAVLLTILAGNLYLVYRFARRLGTTILQAGMAALIVAYHAGLSNLYYDTAYIYDVLCFSFYMGAFLCYARVRAQGRLPRAVESALVVGLCLAALNSKEMALTLPVMLLAYELIYHAPVEWSFRWLVGPGRVTLYCGALKLIYLYGKAFGRNAMMQAASYRPELSLRRIFTFEKASMDSLFLLGQTLNWRGVVLVWILLAYLAWRRPRPALRFCWVFVMFTPPPLAVLEGRGAACLYIPLAGWAVFAAVALTGLASAAAQFLSGEPILRRAGFGPLFAALLLIALYAWMKQNAYLKREVALPAMKDVGRQTAVVLDQMRALDPHVKSGTHIAFRNDPFQDWDMLFIAELWFRDHSLQFHILNKTPLPPEELAKMTVFDFREGRIVQLTGGGSPRP
ncbi:MAG: hypothetical protein ABI806_22755 [Candidatus Solibacter sp.]